MEALTGGGVKTASGFGILSLFPTEEEMARRRWQTKGHLYSQGGCWKLRYWEDVINPESGGPERKRSSPVILAPSSGPAAVTRRQAEALRDKVLAKVNLNSHQPQSLLTLRQFVENRFEVEHLPTCRRGGQHHYRYTLKKVLGAFGDMPLRALTHSHVQRFLIALSDRLSAETLTKLRNTIHTVYAYANSCEVFTGRNPAQGVKIPASAKRLEKISSYTVEEFRQIIAALKPPIREMFMLGAATSMHAGELAALRVRHLHFGDRPKQIEGVMVAPSALVVCESIYMNRRGGPKNRHRKRVLPIPPGLRARLLEMTAGRSGADPVFLMPKVQALGRTTPIDTKNVLSRILQPLGKRFGFPVTWHRIRHCNATWSFELGAEDSDRAAMMGHWSTAMTSRYTNEFERKRRIADVIESRIMDEPAGGVQ